MLVLLYPQQKLNGFDKNAINLTRLNLSAFISQVDYGKLHDDHMTQFM